MNQFTTLRIVIITASLIQPLWGAQKQSQQPACPERERVNCKNCQYYYPKRLSNLLIKSPLYNTDTLCARCFSLSTTSARNACYSCMTNEDKVLRNRNELWCPLYAGNFKQAGSLLNLLKNTSRPNPIPFKQAKKIDACPQDHRRFCVDCKFNYPLIAQTYGIAKPKYDGKMLCTTCFALPTRQQQQWCYNCITDKGVMQSGNEPWCHAYAANFSGSPEFLRLLQLQYRPPIPDDY